MYLEKVNMKVQRLQERMDRINNKTDTEWKKLRKQKLAFLDRVKKRVIQQQSKDQYRHKEETLFNVVSVVQESVPSATFSQILSDCKV